MPEVLPFVGLCPRLLVYRERPLPESLRLLLFWRPRGEVCRQRRILIFHISNTDPSGSCVPNSGFKSEDVFLIRGWAPSEVMFGGTTITAAAFVLYTRLASCVFGEERCP